MSGNVEARTDRLLADRHQLADGSFVWQGFANECLAKFFTRDAELELYRDPFAESRVWGIRLVDVEGTVFAESMTFRGAL